MEKKMGGGGGVFVPMVPPNSRPFGAAILALLTPTSLLHELKQIT